MPVRLRSKSSQSVHLPEIGVLVEPNQIIDRPGELQSQSGDAYLITTGRTVNQVVKDAKGGSSIKPVPEVRAWPKSMWSLVDSAKEKKSEEQS